MSKSARSRVLVCFAVSACAGLVACSSSSTPFSPSASGAGSAGLAAAGQSGAGAQGGGDQAGASAAGASGAVSAGGAAGASGAPAGQGGGSGASTADPCQTALFCDDFDSYTAGRAPAGAWTLNQSGGSVAVDTTHVHSGANAVKITADAATGYRSAMLVLQNTKFLPTAGDVIYGRMMFWLDSAPQGTVHWTFIDGQGLVPGQAYHAIYRYGGQIPILNNGTFVGSQLMANYDTPDSYQTPAVGPSSDCWLHSNMKPVPVAAWACAEWKFDGAASKMQFWLNGTEVTDLAMNGTGQGCVNQPATFPWSAPTFDRIDLGWESYQADDARAIWIDDVAIGTQKIGCPE
jgi:hypothetical protein